MTPHPRHLATRVLLVLAALVTTACGLPRDPEATLRRIEGGTMRVGIADHPPWVVTGDGEPSGIEVELIREMAQALNADIEWVEGESEELAAAIEVGELDLLIAGLTSRSNLSSEAALTHPYITTQVVVATPPRQDLEDIAGVRVAVERYSEAAGILEKTDALPVEVDDVTAVADDPVAIDNYLLDDFDLVDTGVTLIESDHVMAVRHGENAWIVRLERFLLTDPKRVARVVEENDQL